MGTTVYKTKLQDINLSTDMYTASDIENLYAKKCDLSDYVVSDELSNYVKTSDVSSISGDFVHLSGDSNIGTLDLSGSLIVNGLFSVGDNTQHGRKAVAIGTGCIAGSRGYEIKATLASTKQLCCSISMVDGSVSPIDFSEISDLLYSTWSQGSTENIGYILKATNDLNAKMCLLSCDKMPTSSSTHLYFLGNSNIGAIDLPVQGSMAVGYGCKTNGNYSVAEGCETKSGKYGHTEGKWTMASWACHAENCDTSATSYCGHAEGRVSTASGNISHAEGHCTIASNNCTHAAGFLAQAKDKHSYVWAAGKLSSNGTFITESDNNMFADADPYPNFKYQSHGIGTFNVNPKDGINGFYVGENNLCMLLSSAMQQIQTLTNALSTQSLLIKPANIEQFDGNIIEYSDFGMSYEMSSLLNKNEVLDYSFCLRNFKNVRKILKTSNNFKQMSTTKPFCTQNPYITEFHSDSISNIIGFNRRWDLGVQAIMSVDVPNCQMVNKNCFDSAFDLNYINCPNVLSIDNAGFFYATKLKSIYLPNVTSIGQKAFSYTNILSIDFGTDRTTIPEIDSSDDKGTFSNNTNQTSCYIPDNDELYQNWSNDADWKKYIDAGKVVLIKH